MLKLFKSSRGRPKSTRPIRKFTITAMFDEEYDADLLAIIDAAPEGKKWATIKGMMRSGAANMQTVVVEDDFSDDLIDL